jgi:hypothetical protein
MNFISSFEFLEFKWKWKTENTTHTVRPAMAQGLGGAAWSSSEISPRCTGQWEEARGTPSRRVDGEGAEATAQRRSEAAGKLRWAAMASGWSCSTGRRCRRWCITESMNRGKGGGTHRRGCWWRRFLRESSAVASPRRPHLDKKQGDRWRSREVIWGGATREKRFWGWYWRLLNGDVAGGIVAKKWRGGVRPRPMVDAPAGSGPEPLGVDGRHGSIARPAQDRGGHVAVVWAQPQCQGLNPLKPGQTDSNKFEFNLNPFKLILIQTRPLQAWKIWNKI